MSKNIIPIIHTVTPSILAIDILGIQPMSDDIIGIMSPRKSLVIGEDFISPDRWYWVTVPYRPVLHDYFSSTFRKITSWCIEQFGECDTNRWTVNTRTYFFKYEQDRTLFILTWGDT